MSHQNASEDQDKASDSPETQRFIDSPPPHRINEEKKTDPNNVILISPHEAKKVDRREKQASLVLGVVITFLVCIFDASSVACLQLMHQLPPDIQINALSFSLGFICMLVYMILGRKVPRIASTRCIWTVAICVIFIVDNCTLYNHDASFLPLGSIGSLGYAFAIIFSVILSRIFLKEAVTLHKGIALVVTLTGLVLTIFAHVPRFGSSFGQTEICVSADEHISRSIINNPLYNTSHTFSTGRLINDNATILANETLGGLQVPLSPDYTMLYNGTQAKNSQLESTSQTNGSQSESRCHSNNKHDPTDAWTQFISILLLCVSCFCSAMETVILSGSRLKHVSPPVLAFWIFAAGSVTLVPLTFLFEEPIIPERKRDILYLSGYCVCAAGLAFCYIIAAQHLMPMVLSIIESFGIPLMFAVQIVFLRAIAMPSNIWLQIAGIVLVFCTTVVLPIIEYMSLKRVAKARKHKLENLDNIADT